MILVSFQKPSLLMQNQQLFIHLVIWVSFSYKSTSIRFRSESFNVGLTKLSLVIVHMNQAQTEHK